MSCKIALLLSGGVDSTVAGYLLKKAGFEVHAFFLKMKPRDREFDDWREAEGKAVLSARDLKIPFHSIDLREDFTREVVYASVHEISLGYTPNPCIFCNSQIKFGVFWKKVASLGFDLMATGHYARIIQTGKNINVYKGKDIAKDQSYFLYGINKNILPFVKLPLGELTKQEVKKIAIAKINKRFEKTSESQGICFLSGAKYIEFLKKSLPLKKGKVVNEGGKIVGIHPGTWFFTEGQKTGLRDMKYHRGKSYVVKKDIKKNLLTISGNPGASNFQVKKFKLKKLSFFEKPLKKSFNISLKTRYGEKEVAGKIKITNSNEADIVLEESIFHIAPGQSVVFYNGEKMLGGGVKK